MKEAVVSTKPASISRAQEIKFLQHRLALIRELERLLKEENAKLGPAKPKACQRASKAARQTIQPDFSWSMPGRLT